MFITEVHEAARRALLRAKIHLDPGGRARLPTFPGKSRLGSSAWAPALALADHLRPFPVEMLQWWAAQPTGHVVIGGQASTYQPGPVQVRRRTLINVARIAPLDILENETAVLSALGSLFDHLLGCNGGTEDLWLSEGGGLTPEWRRVGKRVSELFRLGYASEVAADSPRAYFAWGLALYCANRRALNLADPLLERLLHTTVMSSDFWSRHVYRPGS